jgi:hypothetical protein
MPQPTAPPEIMLWDNPNQWNKCNIYVSANRLTDLSLVRIKGQKNPYEDICIYNVGRERKNSPVLQV